jgi:hypothetical protein
MMLLDRKTPAVGTEREGKLDRAEFVQDGPGAVADVDALVTPGMMGGPVRPADDAAVAVLLVDILPDSRGWRPESGGKLVWFRLEREPNPE